MFLINFQQKTSPCRLFDVTFSEGEFIAKEVDPIDHAITLKHPQNVPVFTLDREGLLERLYAARWL